MHISEISATTTREVNGISTCSKSEKLQTSAWLNTTEAKKPTWGSHADFKYSLRQRHATSFAYQLLMVQH